MRSILIVVMLLTPAAASKIEYVDYLLDEAVGNLQPRTYDLQLHDHFGGIGRTGGTLLAGGFGLRMVAREPSGNSNGGVRISAEASGQGGRILGSTFGAVGRAELLVGVGYEGTLGILVLHTATILGFDYQHLDVSKNASLDSLMLRAGQQIGAHLQVARLVALYADATLDWDGQWRARAGISIGQALKTSQPLTSSRASTAALAPAAPAHSSAPSRTAHSTVY
jgi:hypothetical protein